MSKESSKEVFYIICQEGLDDEWTTVEETPERVLQYTNDTDYAPVRVFRATVGEEVTIERKGTVKVKPVGK